MSRSRHAFFCSMTQALKFSTWFSTHFEIFDMVFAGSLEAAYSLNWGAREIWGKGGGETLALL